MVQHNRSRVIMDTWLVRVSRIIAWAWLVLWLAMGLVGLGDLISGKKTETVDHVMPFVCLFVAVLHILWLRHMGKTSALLRDFRLYCAVFAKEPEKSISDLSLALNRPIDEVMNRLQAMCRRGYFNGYIDHQRQCMQFSGEAGAAAHAVYCPGCGAPGVAQASGGVCRYCGAPLHL